VIGYGGRRFGYLRVTARKFNARECVAVWLALLLVWFGVLAGASAVLAQGTAPIISRIQIEGNQRVEESAIRINISSQPGRPLDENLVDQDVKAISKMGFFEAGGVQAEVRKEAGQNVLVFVVKERPQITDVRLEGMKAIRTNDDKVVAAAQATAAARDGGAPAEPALLQRAGIANRRSPERVAKDPTHAPTRAPVACRGNRRSNR
jgi:outer membrane protein assembly factor BamA